MEIRFLGAAREVTGSCYLITCNGQQIIVDCGLVQGSRRDEERNREPFPFNPARLDAVILTHSHLDHSGRLPLLIKSGFSGLIYTHPASSDLCRIMLKDAAYINEKEAEWENRKRDRKHLVPVAPLYTLRDAQAALNNFQPLDYNTVTEILPGIKVCLRDAGHILGSAIVELWLEEQGLQRKLVFSGDLGHRGTPILRDPAVVHEADLVILESTYGDRLHRSWEATWQELAEIFTGSKNQRGNFLIPAFTVGRTQELLYTFRRFYQDWGMDRWQIFLDSPMAIEATEVYVRHSKLFDDDALRVRDSKGDPFALPNLTLSETAEQSMQINRITSGAIIIAGSGMCEGGRIKHHLKHNIWRNECQVLIVGYQARNTLGRALVDGAKHIRLWGETIRVAAKIHTIGGLSAHADCDGLRDWYLNFNQRPPVALVHGEVEVMEHLARRLAQDTRQTIHIPRQGERLDLARL
ncbi:MAG: MBL fold metallo-hydrolase [Gammaproteobacteria bacterium RBG_16_57_12]|nr:MAG: MBL fold metallo-hydrolase [Gammaproteobacteria bacterium RBG_16_57_12]